MAGASCTPVAPPIGVDGGRAQACIRRDEWEWKGEGQGCTWKGGRPADAQPLSPSRQVPASTAFATDSDRPQPPWQTPPTACLTAFGAASEVPSLLMRPWGGGPKPPRLWTKNGLNQFFFGNLHFSTGNSGSKGMSPK